MKYLLLALVLCNTAFAQPCTKTDDLLSIPGSLKDHTKFPIGGGTFSAQEKPVAMKTLIAAKIFVKKYLPSKEEKPAAGFTWKMADSLTFTRLPVTA